MKNYYKILGVSKTATDEEIKKAYKKLSMKYHPDRPSGSEEKFKEINEAHEVLMDPIKRMQFNQGETPTGSKPENGDYYHETPRHNFKFSGNNPPNGFNFDQFNEDSSFGTSFFRGGTSFENIFGNNGGFNMNGFPFSGNGNTQQQTQEQSLKLSFEEMFKGGNHTISYTKQVRVDDEIVNIPDTIPLTIPPKCYIGKKFKLTVPIGDGEKYVIIIIIKPKKHKFYKLRESSYKTEQNDLEITMPLSLKDSLVGFRLKIPGIDGKLVIIEEDEVIDPRAPYRLSGKGFVDKNGNRGDLYINFDIKYPKKLSQKQRNEIKKLLT
jgi:DnaJ-class molecular chaperone